MELQYGIIYLFTMMLMLVKSRFIFMGKSTINNFEPIFMSFMGNKIIDSMNLDLFQLRKSKHKTMQRWTSRPKPVQVFSKKVYIHLTKKDFKLIWSRKLSGVYNIIEPVDATKFIKRSLTGTITKEMLDDARVAEINGIDMMLHTTIFYHPGSIIELQTICLLFFTFYKEDLAFDEIRL
jgi:hypothetical protein